MTQNSQVPDDGTHGFVWLEFSDGSLMKRETEFGIRQTGPHAVGVVNKTPVEFGPITQVATIVAILSNTEDDPSSAAREDFLKAVSVGDTVVIPGDERAV